MPRLLQQFQRGVLCRQPLSCASSLHPFTQYPVPWSWCTQGFLPTVCGVKGSPFTLRTVAGNPCTIQPVLGNCPPLSLAACARLASSVFVKSGGRCSITGLSAAKVAALPICEDLQEGLQRLGIRRLAEVQRNCLLRALGGTSLIVAANPGSGKTLAYLLPVLQRFLSEDGRRMLDMSNGSPPSPFALILVPSRELARQVANVAMALLPQAPVLLLDPASPVRHHQQMLSHLPAKIVVSTPDRVRSLMRERRPQAEATGKTEHVGSVQLSLKNLHILVVDEADCLLRRDYHSKVRFICKSAMSDKASEGTGSGERLRGCTNSFQLLCFSAVLPQNLLDIFESDFPHAEVLNLLDAAQHTTQGVDMSRHTPTEGCADAPSNKSGSPGSAVVGAGVKHHICYVPSWSASSTSQDIINDELASPQKRTGRRRSQTTEEAHIEKERKMLALAEALRTFIPRLMHGSRSSNIGGLAARGTDDDASSSGDSERQEHSSKINRQKHLVDIQSEDQTSAAVLEPLAEEGISTEAEGMPEGEPLQCIVFADSQEEVRYIKNHPLLDSWRIASVHSRMDAHDRERAIQSFLEGDASVLVSTDIAARGFDIPSVVLVVHLHPPSTPENYTHRTGRAGRGKIPGTSVVLCSSVELHRLRDIERLGRLCFERRTLPAAADCQDLMLKQLIADMLNVPYSQYAPLLDVAQRLQETLGAQALATVLLKLGGATAHGALGGPASESRSVLSGRQGFVPLLLYDPTHARLQGSTAARRLLQGLLPRAATPEAIGRIVKSVNGFVADVSTTYVDHIVQEGKRRGTSSSEPLSKDCSTSASANGFKESWVPIFHLDQLPRLLSGGIGRRRHGRRLPWARMKLSLARSRKESRRQAAQKDGVLKSDSLHLQALKNMNAGSATRS